jgi:hypothetical protein
MREKERILNNHLKFLLFGIDNGRFLKDAVRRFQIGDGLRR